ncbi:unnamed protein product [Hymenolepis diminuta]|uniref:Uncharacterized protein n=1 Tax=Hymenolepis diminuta TaxID=6216 RepID=A0A564Y8Q7_HYMDI|nr:unnamed protein product [Hymenolepis diminuta]
MFSCSLTQVTHKTVFVSPLRTRRTHVRYWCLRFPLVSSALQHSPPSLPYAL